MTKKQLIQEQLIEALYERAELVADYISEASNEELVNFYNQTQQSLTTIRESFLKESKYISAQELMRQGGEMDQKFTTPLAKKCDEQFKGFFQKKKLKQCYLKVKILAYKKWAAFLKANITKVNPSERDTIFKNLSIIERDLYFFEQSMKK